MKERLRNLKIKRPKIKNPVKHFRERRANKADVTTKAIVPLITTESIAEHREEVLKGARKYIYPLQHSRHRIVIISTTIFIFTVIALFGYGAIALYRLQTTSTFVYRISQVVPFPVARTKSSYVSYESYLFELRHYMHYYEAQEKKNFDTSEGQQQLIAYKQRALDRVVDDAYIKDLARQHDVSISNQEIDTEIAVVKEQNRLGDSDQVFEDVLRDFWGWSLSDFKRSLKQQLLARKVVSKLDETAHTKAKAALEELKAGISFADVAKKYSDDVATKDVGGDYGALINKSNRDVAAQTSAAMFALEPGKYSDIIDTGYSLEIVKLNGFEGDKARASHIQITFMNINDFINPLKEQQKPRLYIKT